MSQTLCTSLRYVAPPGSVLVENLAALWGADAALAEKVDPIVPGNRIEIATSKSGEPTASVKLFNGKTVQLHSRYAPRDEAIKTVDRVADFDGLAYFVLGFGLGYHVLELLSRISKTACVWIIEPDLELIRVACETLDLTPILGNPKVTWITEIDRPKLLTQFASAGAILTAGVTTLEHAPSIQRSSAFYAEAKSWIEDVCSYSKTSINTLVLNSNKTLTNVARNLPWYVSTPGPARLEDAYKGQPAIIVSAGPSLRKNKHLLLEAKGKAVIIAVQTTLKPLLEMGVEPDFVTSLDYSEISARFFQDLPRDLKTELVADAKASETIFDLFPGPVTLLGNELSDDLLRDALKPRTKLRSGATVAHLAFYLAEYMGCDPIAFIGQDMGFSDGLCYTPGTTYDDVWRPELGRFCTMEMKQWEQIVRERPILRKIPDYLGRPMYTEQRLFTYLQQFERDFAASKARVVDATEGGANKTGTRKLTLADTLALYCEKPLRPFQRPYAGRTFDYFAVTTAALERRIDEARQMREIAGSVAPLLEEIRDNISDQPRVNRAIARIDPLREKMNTFGRTYDLVMYLAQKHEFDRFKKDMAIQGRDVEPVERQLRQVQRDLDNARNILTATDLFIDLLRDSIRRVELASAKSLEVAA
jgi:hypothetical protein